MMIYVRSIANQPLQLRKYGPKKEDSPTLGRCCPICNHYLLIGDYTTLIPLGPGEDPQERRKCRLGQFYNAIAIEAHYDCVTGGPEELT